MSRVVNLDRMFPRFLGSQIGLLLPVEIQEGREGQARHRLLCWYAAYHLWSPVTEIHPCLGGWDNIRGINCGFTQLFSVRNRFPCCILRTSFPPSTPQIQTELLTPEGNKAKQNPLYSGQHRGKMKITTSISFAPKSWEFLELTSRHFSYLTKTTKPYESSSLQGCVPGTTPFPQPMARTKASQDREGPGALQIH